MALTLASAKSTLQTHLQDLTSLIFSSTTLEEAIRSSLRSLNRISDPAFTISGLDGSASTSITNEEEPIIIDGGVAYALNFRAVGLYGDPSPDEDLPQEFSDYAQARMNLFLSLLTQYELGSPIPPDEHAHELAVIAAKHANDLIIQSAEHTQQDSIQASEHTQQDSIQASEHTHETSIQSAEHTQQDSIQASDQAHDLAVIAAKHANKKEIILDENTRQDAKDAAEQTRLEGLQQSTDHPYTQWDLEEGEGDF